MSFQRLRRVRDDARLFHLVGNGICTVRLVVSIHQFQKFIQTVFHVFYLGTELVCYVLYEQFHAAFLIGRSVHQAQLSVSLETVVSSFPHDFPCAFLCEYREKVQQGFQTSVRVVESPSPLLVIVSLCSARLDKQDRAYPRIRWTWSPSRQTLCQVRTTLASRLSCPLGAVSTLTVPLFSRLPWVLSPLRSSQCSTTGDEFQSFVQWAHRADVSASQLVEQMPSPLNTPIPG